MIGKRSLRSIVVSAIAAVCCGPIQHAHATEDDAGLWAIFSTTNTFGSEDGAGRWHYWFDAQARYVDPGSGANQWLARPAIGYEIRDGIKAWAGYARFRSRNSAGRVSGENRYWQQLDWRAGHLLGGRVTMRARLEQRSVDAGDDLGIVLRLMTKYVRPLSADGNTTLIVGLEPFVDLKDTDWGGASGIAQNRAFVGMGWAAGNKLTFEAGYMNQYAFADRGPDRINHLVILTLKARL